MRTVFVLAFTSLAACSPEVAPGTYVCGPEELCPDDLKCDRVTAICEVPASANEFACGDMHVDVPGDDAPATAQSLGDFACVSLVTERRSCLPVGDSGDFYTFKVADNCTSVHVQASVVYPIAFERLVLQLAKQGETPVTIDTKCNRTGADGDGVSCLDAPVGPGTYVIGVVPDGTGTCDNECRFNRYGISVQVTTQ